MSSHHLISVQTVLLVAMLLVLASTPCIAYIGFEVLDPVEISAPSDLAVADVDGDQQLDVIVLSSSDDELLVFPGDGNGGLGEPRSHDVGDEPTLLELADLDTDGDLDIVVTNLLGDSVSLLLGDGQGGFANAVELETGSLPTGLAIADFDEDGELDIAVCHHGSSNVVILFGDGEGDFPDSTSFPVTRFPSNLVAGDLDSDGSVDLVVMNSEESDFFVYGGRGDGTFFDPVIYELGIDDSIWDAALVDVDGDDALDLLLPCSYQDRLGVFLGTASGVFSDLKQFCVGLNPVMATAGDFDQDGILDLATVNSTGGDISALPGSALIGVLAPVPTLGMASLSDRAASTMDSAPSARINEVPTYDIDVEAGSNRIGVGDMDNDGRIDLVVSSYLSDSLQVLINKGVPPAVPVFRRGDVNRDGAVRLDDAIALAHALFTTDFETTCPDALDVDDSGHHDLLDVIQLLRHLLVDGSPTPPEPGAERCGVDPTDDLFEDCSTDPLPCL